MKVRISQVPNKFAGGGEIPPYRTGDPSVLKRDLNNRVILPSFNDLFSNHRPEDIYEEEGYIPLEQGKGHQYTYNDIYTDYIGRLNKYNQSLLANDSANILTNEKRTSQGLNRIGDTGAMPVVNDMFKGVNTLLGYGMQAPIELAKTALMPGSYIPYAGATNQMGELIGGAVDNAAGALFAPIMLSNYIDWGSAGRDGIHLKLPWQSNSNGIETPAFMLTMDFVAAPYLAKGVGKIAKWGKQYVNPFYESRNQPINLINERVNRILQTSSEPTTLMPERMEASVIEPARTSLLEPERTPEAYRTTLESPVRRTSSVSRDMQEPLQSIIEIPESAEVLTSAELARLLRQLERQQNTHIAQEAPIQGFDWSAFDEYERGFLRPTTEEIVLPINRQRGYNDRSILNESLNAEDFKLELANDYGIPIKEIDHFLQEKGLDLNDLKVRRKLSWSASEDLENFAKSYKKDLYSRHPELAETLIEFISDKTGLNKNFIGELLRKLNPEYFLRNISEISNLNNFIDNYYYFTDSAPMKMYSPKDYLSSDIYNELKKAMSDEEINNAFDKLLNKHRFIDYRDLQKIAAYPQQLKVSYSPIEGLNNIVALQEFSKNFGKHAHDNIERGEHNVFSKIRSGVRRAMNPEAELSINEPLDFNFSANSVNLILAMAKALSKERKALKRFPGMIQRNGDFRLRGNSYGNVNLGTKEEPKIGDIYGTIPTIEEMRTYPSRAEALLPINKNLAQTYKYFVENNQGKGMPQYHMDLKMLLDVIDAGGDVSKVPGAADATFTIGDDPTPIYMFGKFPETFNAPSYPNIRFVFNNGGSLSSNLFPDGGTLDDDDIPINNTLNTVNVYPTKIPGFQKWWNKTFRSKEGYYDWADRYADRHPQDANTIIVNPEEHTIINQRDLIADNAKALSESGLLPPLWDRNLTIGANEERIIQGQKNVRENALRSQALQVAENAERGLFPVYDDESNIVQYLPYNLALYSNDKPLSNTDPMAEFYVMNKALNPLLKLIGRGTQQVMARAGNQWARNQIMGRAFNNAADASFGFNNRFTTTPASSMGYEIKPNIRTKVGDIELNDPNLMYHTDLGDGLGQFNHIGASIENGYLIPGPAKIQGQKAYTRWNLEKPYRDSKVRLTTTSKYNPDLIHVRSTDYPIGQWSGKNGKSFVLNTEYVAEKPINVTESTYLYDPSYGYRKITPVTNSARTSFRFLERPNKLTYTNPKEWTPEQWTAAQDAAIAKGDMAEAQRLRDLHFKVNAPNTKVKEAVFNGSLSDKPFYEFNTNFRDAYWGGRDDYTTGAWFGTGDENTLLSFAGDNPNRLKKFYLNFSNPFIKDAGYRRWDKLLPFNMTEEDIVIEAAKLREKGFPEYIIEDWKNKLKTTTDNYALKLETTDYDSGIIKNVYENKAHPDSEYGVITDYIAAKPNQIKSVDAVTYNDNGIRIPLGKRDNFNINDIRYGLAPLGFGIPYLMNNNNQ